MATHKSSSAATRRQSATPFSNAVVVRRAKPQDARACGIICYEAFTQINIRHGFPPDFPNVDAAIGVLSMMFSHPGFYCVVAEFEGKIAGSNCLDERSPIAGVGPITVNVQIQNQRIGRALMQAVLDRAAERKFPGVRLLQAAFHNRSLSLYAKLGFAVREFVSVMQGPPIKQSMSRAMSGAMSGYQVRTASEADVESCNSLCQAVHGHERGGELTDAIKQGTAVVAEHGGGISAYATSIGFFGHAVGRTNYDLQALLASAPAFLGPGILVPPRNAGLFRWCLENGLKVIEPMTLMTMGLYNEPAGAYLPSILY
jgi:GNAT superfamily N-acetyltransferase